MPAVILQPQHLLANGWAAAPDPLLARERRTYVRGPRSCRAPSPTRCPRYGMPPRLNDASSPAPLAVSSC